MLSTLLDFFCSRPFAETPTWRVRATVAANALLWFVVALGAGWSLGLGFAVPGESTAALAAFSGATPAAREAFPLLWGVVGLLGEAPSVLALNVVGAAVMGLAAALTLVVVRFWALDAMDDDSIVGARRWLSLVVGNVAAAMFVFSLPGLYALTGFGTAVWSFALLLLCVALQNAYAMGGGHRRAMGLFALALGVAAVESPWVLAALPLFFMRAAAIEWRLWDRNVRNLPLWFIALAVGVALALAGNALRMGDLSLAGLWRTEAEVLRAHVATLRGFASGPWLINVGAAGLWPLLAWITARRLLNNDRAWGLLFTALALTVVGFGLMYGVAPAPLRGWLAVGAVPVATAWATAVAGAMLVAGWGVQLFARNPNIYEELDRRRMPAQVTAMRVSAIFLFPLAALAAGVTLFVHGRRFASVDRGMADRFAAETVTALAKGSGSLAEGRAFVLGATWIDRHLALGAQTHGVPLTLFSPARAQDKAYLADLEHRLETDPLLGDADRLRLTNLLKYNFLVFVQDFFVSQENVAQIAASYDLPDVWYAARLRPLPCGTLYLGAPEDGKAPDGLLEAQRAFQERWAETLKDKALPWFDLNAGTLGAIRHHLAFLANNLGTVLDDQGSLAEAAQCYLYASETDPENISALLNLYDICVRRGQLPDRREKVNRAFQEFIAARAKSPRKYDLSAVGRYFGYIRNYDLFVQMGWDWAVSAAPESVLAGLRNAQSGLAPTDPRNAAVQAVSAAVYELQGQTQRSAEGYRAAVKSDPKNVEALRGLARLSIQSGKANEAGQWLAKAEQAGGDQNALDLDRAAYAMAIGDLEGARKTIGRYTKNNQDSAAGWAMLGMLEIEQGHLDRATGFVAQQLLRTAKGRDLYFLHVLHGRLASAEAQKAEAEAARTDRSDTVRNDAAKLARTKWYEARNHYRRAYALRPNVRGLLEMMLDFNRRLGEKADAEADALAILREDPRHPGANFIVGSQRLEDGHVEAAIKYFRVAVDGEGTPSVDLVNNYADALARTPNAKLAKEMGLRAVTLAKESYGTWGTYALTLARGGETEKAKGALGKARSLPGGNDPRLGYVDIWIALAQKDKAAALKARDTLRAALGARLAPLDLRDLKEIDAALDAIAPDK